MKTKFVKRYPRALVRRLPGGSRAAYVLHHPSEKPTENNMVGVQYPTITATNFQKVLDHLEVLRSEPS